MHILGLLLVIVIGAWIFLGGPSGEGDEPLVNTIHKIDDAKIFTMKMSLENDIKLYHAKHGEYPDAIDREKFKIPEQIIIDYNPRTGKINLSQNIE